MLTDEDRKNLMTKFWQHAEVMGQSFRPHPPKIGQVYAFEMSDNTVKIGATSKSEKRIHEVEQKVYLKVLRWHFTDFAPYEFITKTELHCHSKFDARRVRGEFFDIPFEEACAELDRYNETFNAALKAADEKLLDEIDVYFNDFLPLYEAHQSKYPIKLVPADAAPAPDIASLKAQIEELQSVLKPATSAPEKSALQAQIDELRKGINEYKALVEMFINLLEECRTEIKRPLTDFERADKLLIIADKISDPVKKETILIKAANLFVDKKFV